MREDNDVLLICRRTNESYFLGGEGDKLGC